MAAPTSPTVLTDAQRAFLRAPRYAALATIDPDGSPRQAVAWYDLLADDRLLLNSRHGRRWPANLLRDGRIALAVIDADDGESWLGVTGAVDEVIEDVERARDDIVALAHRYAAPSQPEPGTIATFRSQPRVTVLVRIDDIHDHLEGG
jgi:PPOX class probable F420-dependent enzyme